MGIIKIKENEESPSYKKKLRRVKLKGLNTKKYCGKLKLTENPLEIQRRLRSEWK